MVKLIAKKKIGFRNPETGEVAVAEPYAFATLPDWVAKDPMYAWAKDDGSIEVSGEEAKPAAASMEETSEEQDKDDEPTEEKNVAPKKGVKKSDAKE